MLISTPLNRAPEMEKDKRPQTKSKPDVSPTFCASLRSRNAQWTCHKTHLTREFAGKIPRQERKSHFWRKKAADQEQAKLAAQTLREPAQSKHTWHGHRAILCGNLQGKCRGPEWAPRSSTGLNLYHENPSVWGHTVWGKKHWTKQKNWSNATFTSKNQDLIRYMDVSQDSSGYDCRLVHPSRWVLAPGIHRQYYSTSKNGKNDWGISQSAYSMSSLILVSHGFSEWVAIQTDTGSLAACNALYHCLPLLRWFYCESCGRSQLSR